MAATFRTMLVLVTLILPTLVCAQEPQSKPEQSAPSAAAKQGRFVDMLPESEESPHRPSKPAETREPPKAQDAASAPSVPETKSAHADNSYAVLMSFACGMALLGVFLVLAELLVLFQLIKLVQETHALVQQIWMRSTRPTTMPPRWFLQAMRAMLEEPKQEGHAPNVPRYVPRKLRPFFAMLGEWSRWTHLFGETNSQAWLVVKDLRLQILHLLVNTQPSPKGRSETDTARRSSTPDEP